MLRALAILLSLVCLNAQAPEDAHIISIPHDAICPQTQVNEALETGYKNCIQGTDGGNCKEFLRKVTIWVKKAFEELQKLTPAHERTSQSRAPQDHDIEMGLLESELPKCAEETVPRESIKEFCVKVYEAFRTALEEIVDQTPILSAMRNNCPTMNAIAFVNFVGVLVRFSLKEHPEPTYSPLNAQFYLFIVQLYFGGLVVEVFWRAWQIWRSRHTNPVDAIAVPTAPRRGSTNHYN